VCGVTSEKGSLRKTGDNAGIPYGTYARGICYTDTYKQTKEISGMPYKALSLTKKVNLQFTAVQSAYWMSFLPIGGFSVVLLQSRNFSSSEIGILLAMQSVASVAAQPLISSFAGRHPRIALKKIICAMLFIAAAFYSLFLFLPHLFVPALLIVVVMGATESSVPSFINALAMQFTNAGVEINYGLSRGIGSLAYALAGAALGKLIDMTNVNIIIPFFVITALSACIFLFTMKTPAAKAGPAGGAEEEDIPGTNLLTFLKAHKSYTGFCAASAFLITSHTFINNYLPNIMSGLGGTVTDQGIVRSIAAAFEIPIMLLYIYLSRRVNSKKLLTVSALFFFLKTLATMLVPNVGFLFAVQLLQLPAFGLYTPAAVEFSDRSVSGADRVRAQAVSMVSAFGIGNIAGNLGGGLILDKWGLKPMLAAAVVVGFVGFIIMAVSMHEKKTEAL